MRINLGIIAIDINEPPGSSIPPVMVYVALRRDRLVARKKLFRRGWTKARRAISWIGIQIVVPFVWTGTYDAHDSFDKVEGFVCPHLRYQVWFDGFRLKTESGCCVFSCRILEE